VHAPTVDRLAHRHPPTNAGNRKRRTGGYPICTGMKPTPEFLRWSEHFDYCPVCQTFETCKTGYDLVEAMKSALGKSGHQRRTRSEAGKSRWAQAAQVARQRQQTTE
jgi:hypothetical protein